MRRRFSITLILAALSAAAAASGTAAPEYLSKEHKTELFRAETGLVYAAATYHTNNRTCRSHIEKAIAALQKVSPLYEKGSLARIYVDGAVEYLAALEARMRRRLVDHVPAAEEEMQAETAKLCRMAADVSALMRGEDVDPLAISANFKLLREEVRTNEAAGKGDVEAQIGALRAEAARLNEEAEAVEEENRQLDERAQKIERVMDFWKSNIGEDQAYICPYR